MHEVRQVSQVTRRRLRERAEVSAARAVETPAREEGLSGVSVASLMVVLPLPISSDRP